MQPRTNIVGLLAFLIIWHCAILCSNILQPSSFGARIVGLRYFVSRSLYSVEELLQHNLHACILVFSVVVLVIHCRECDFIFNPDELERSHLLIVKVHSHLHMTRAILTLIQCFGMKTYLRQQLQKAVSTSKRRYMNQEIKVDLDLTYICDRLIAMALPCVDDAVHRNDIRDVAKLLATKHYGVFLVFNLCEDHEENGNGNYDTDLLYGQVCKIPFYDHNAPLLTQLVRLVMLFSSCDSSSQIRFCETASHWLEASPQNMVIVHCRGGKGRTGLFVSSLMLWTRVFKTCSECMLIARSSD